MKAFENKRIKVASKDRAQIDLSSKVITTNDFGNIQVNFLRELVPGDQVNINMSSFARLAPMPVPTYANIKHVTRAFYVKARSLWKPFDDFYSGRETYIPDGYRFNFTCVPNVSNADIFNLFKDTANGLAASRGVAFDTPSDIPASQVYDFLVYEDDIEQYALYSFTIKGKRFYSLLANMGIRINFTEDDVTPISLLPFLAYCRVWYDHFLPSRYSNNSILREFFSRYDWDDDDNNKKTLLLHCASILNYFYEDDYFTSAWNSPYSPDPSQAGFNNIGVTEPLMDEDTLSMNDPVSVKYNNYYGAVLDTGKVTSAGDPVLTQFGIDALKRIYDFGMRRGLAGNKYFDSIFTEFGIQLPEVELDKSLHIGSSVKSALLQDVTSQAQTDNNGKITALGDYAGKGHLYDESANFSFEAKDFGYLIVVSFLVPDTGYVQGTNREMSHIDRLSFFTPEFDKLGMQAIANREIYQDFKDSYTYDRSLNHGGKPDGIFGFTPRYSEYKVGRDILSGDFICKSYGADLDAYHTFRMFDAPNALQPLANTQAFRILDVETNGNNFNRIFNDTSNYFDHFICSYDLRVTAHRKMSSIQDSIELDGGQEITVKTN